MSKQWKHALVIGASSGIGKAIAEALIAEGVHTAMMARRAEPIYGTADTANYLAVPPSVSVDELGRVRAERDRLLRLPRLEPVPAA